MKKITALILSAILIFAMAMPAFAAGNEIVKAEAFFYYPKAGDKVEYKDVQVGNDDEYSARIDSIYYMDKDYNVVHVKNGDEYTEGIMYRMRILFTANSGYHISGGCEFWVNEEKQIGSVGTNLAEISFRVAKDGSIDPSTGQLFEKYNSGSESGGEDEPEPELNFFQRIAAFFSGLVERIRVFFASLFPKV